MSKYEKPRGLAVNVINGNVDKAIKTFLAKVKKEGIVRECRDRSFFEKPSVVKARRNKAAKSRARRQNQTLND